MATNKLLQKLQSAGAIDADILSESTLFNERDLVPTSIPMLNVALSGSLDGGITPGVTVVAGESKTFKTLICLFLVSEYMHHYDDAICLFYDNEFGTTKNYTKMMKVDENRVIHIPFNNLEELKFDIVKRLESVERGDRVVVFVDSLGNAASKKEIDDAMEEKSTADMTRAKQMKSLFRMITPHFTTKDIPGFFIAHTYQSISFIPKAIVSGGTGIYYSGNTIWIITRAQDKDGKEITGYFFTLNVEKSRFVKEKSKIALQVSFDKGINKWSGLLDNAVEAELVEEGKVGKSKGYRWFENADFVKEENIDFWGSITNDIRFKQFIEKKYRLGGTESD